MNREEAIRVLKGTIAYESDFAEAKRMAIEALSADAAQVVQCGDCIWYDGRSKGCNRSGGLTMYPLHEYDFCSYIERKRW